MIKENKSIFKKCASCGKEKQFDKMKIFMDSRPMHRYACDTKCMLDFYRKN